MRKETKGRRRSRPKKYRLVTRSGLDGLVSAVLLKELDLINEIAFARPQEIQEGRFRLTARDIATNLPFGKGAHLAFAHHISEARRARGRRNYINDPAAPSASRVLYEYFGGERRFPPFTRAMMKGVDKTGSARLSLREVLRPRGWVLLHFLLDPRTGLERFRKFRVPDAELIRMLSDACRTQPIHRVLRHLDVIERSGRYFVLREKFCEQLRRCATARDGVVVLDLRKEEPIWAGNRFMIYALFPECSVSVQLTRSPRRRNTEVAVGKSIFDRSARLNIGQLLLEHGGGGHEAAGACTVPNAKTDRLVERLIEAIVAGG